MSRSRARSRGAPSCQVRTKPDQLFDHYAVEYKFPDGTRLFAQGRHMQGCWGFFGDVIQGSKASAVLGEGISDPRIYKGFAPVQEDIVWQQKGNSGIAYQIEHELLFDAIRNNKPYNEAKRSAYAAMVGILGRMAAESGKEITLNGAFVTCPRPLMVGETFRIKIIFENQNPLTLEADVIWNNNNVPGNQVVARGMKVRFLKLTDENRILLNEMFAAV